MAEQFALHHVIRQRGAVQRQERLFATRAAQMAGAGQNILAGTGIADDQQRRIEHRQLARLLQHVTHLGAHRHDVVEFGIVVHR